MKISELIPKLLDDWDLYGDLPVKAWSLEFQDYEHVCGIYVEDGAVLIDADCFE